MTCPTCSAELHASEPASQGVIYAACSNGHRFYGRVVAVGGPEPFAVELVPIPEIPDA